MQSTALSIALAAAAILVGGVLWLNAPQESSSDIVSRTGLHWHPQLLIYVKDEAVEIPHNIGLGAVHSPMHTHEDLPIIHLEFNGIVRTDDTRLGNFFRIWGKDMSSFGPNLRMTVNGQESTEYENYAMRDGDKIELRYE